MYALINTFDRFPDSIGTILSLHRSVEAAEKSNSQWQRDIKKGHGRNAYLPTQISKLCKARWKKGQQVYASEIVDES